MDTTHSETTHSAPTDEQIEALKVERTRVLSRGAWVRLVEGGRHGGRWYVPCERPTRPYWDGRRWRKENHRFCRTPYHMIAIDVTATVDDSLFEAGRRWLVGAIAASAGFLGLATLAACAY